MKKIHLSLLILLLLFGFQASSGQSQANALMSIPPEFPDRPFIFMLDSPRMYDGELFLAFHDGQAPVSISLGQMVTWDFGWSPDGRWISYVPIEIFENNSYDDLGNYAFDFVTESTLRIDNEYVLQAVPYDFFSWSTRWLDNNLLSFSSDDNTAFFFLDMLSKTYRTWEMPVHGRRSLGSNSIMFLDGNRWLYSNVYDAPEREWGNSLEIAIWDDVSQSATILLENGPSTERFPILSPNRQEIAYTYAEGDKAFIAVMNNDGTNHHVVFSFDKESNEGWSEIRTTQIITELEWSPDSQRLAFLAGNVIYTVRADGSDLQLVGRGYSKVAWLSNELLYDAVRQVYLMTDGKIIEPPRYGNTLLRKIIMLPDTADDYFMMRIEHIMNSGFNSPIELATASPLTIGCPGAPQSRIQIATAETVYNVPQASALVQVNVHRVLGGEVLGSLNAGSLMSIVNGPVCWNNMMWWQIESADGSLAGWISEGASPADYYIMPQN